MMRRDPVDATVTQGSAGVRPAAAARTRRVAGWLTVLGVILLGLNLRAAIAGLAPLLPEVQADLALSRTAAGLLTTLPVLCFAVLSPVAALLGRRVGIEMALLLAMLGIVAGSLVRTVVGAGWMLAGTAIIGAGIAVGNVLVPSIVKQDFPERQGSMTGISTAALTGGAALAAAVAAPLAHDAGLGWRGALLVVGGFAAIAAVVWLPQLRSHHVAPAVRLGGQVLRSPITWQLAVFMGMQSMTYYAVLAWLPALLGEKGVDATGAGWALSLFNLLGIATSVLLPALAAHRRDQRGLGLLTCALWGAGLLGLLVAPSLYLVWAVLMGFAQGAGIGLAFALIVLRARNPESARDLSGIVQAIGYLLGAGGPLVMGVLRDSSGGWSLPLTAMCAAVAVMAGAVVGAGRDRHV
jgi:MFS transporter, CP family, cyanate transporter